MTTEEFGKAVLELCERFVGSETSGRRTYRHNLKVGGRVSSPHLVGLGRDVVWDTLPELSHLEEEATLLGLHVIREDDHDHLQPLDWKAV